MTRIAAVSLATLLLLTTVAGAADGPAGSWKLHIPDSTLTILFKLEEKGGKWSAKFLGITEPIRGGKEIVMGDPVITMDSIRLGFKIPGGADFSFDGKLPPDEKSGKIAGSLEIRGNQLILTHLEPSKLKAFDRFDFNKEMLEQSTEVAVLLDSALDLIAQSADKKAKPEDARGWADKAFKPSEAYGSRWQRTVATRLAEALSANKDLAPVAIEYARKAERLLDPDDEPAVQMETLETVAQVLAKADKADDAKKVQATLAKLEERDYAEYLKKASVKPEPYEGRKVKSDRAVLVELLTGATLEPGAAAGAVFQALEKTYKGNDVILVQYHLPRRDAFEILSNSQGMDRAQAYIKQMQFKGVIPTVLLNGKAGPNIGGAMQAATPKYKELRDAINALLEKPADAKIDVTAARKGNEISIKATYSDAAKTGDNIKLRFILVDDRVRYAGGNGLRYQQYVARAFPGGLKGFPVAKKSGEQAVTVNLDTVRAEWNKYLDELTGGDPNFVKPERLVAMPNVHIVALIQDDDSGDVLQAVQVEAK